MGRKIIDLTGSRYGKLTVMEYAGIKNQGAYWKVRCDCGKEKSVRYSSLYTGDTKSCGCTARELFIQNCTGKNNHNYIDGLSAKNRVPRRSPEYALWTREVKEKYKATCQKCFTKEKPQAHHILSYQTNPQIRTDVNNGIVFCQKCHVNFHKKYTLRNNTQLQVIDYCNSFYCQL